MLQSEYPIHDLGNLHYFHGLEVNRTIDGIHLIQDKYVSKLLKKAWIDAKNSCPTPTTSSRLISKFDGDPFPNAKEYR